ncbi:DsbA family oxidoreductase [Thalassotalea sp. 1_MG-2023]|uniref:DsbA family oxidoreductase n=1 Tax=Thalassotalea sp. 1_MG-2023 TaxID=3062680 RepID=UPI0026E16A16|nr:DsbA family oxidoreductase [Thalassotalea sp. 1_MG-2023]MDO6428573.1 DsbA family oxidoreductase [Thalassotalea sp. 1_MG-2023]
MTEKINIDIISDVVCPWCIVGYKHLEAAIIELNLQDNVELQWQPFELNPDMPLEGEELSAHMARKYGSSKAESEQARNNITKAAADYGFHFNYVEGMKIVNTFDVHILLDYAHSLGLQTALKMRLFSAYFSENKDISNKAVLIKEAEEVGITSEQSITAFENNEIKQRVKALESQWQSMGVSGVPTVIFNRTTALTGAQPQETYKQALLSLMK